MDDSTTTVPTPDDGAVTAQPDSQPVVETAENQPAVSNDTNTDSQEAEATPTDDNLAWLQNKGIDPTDPEAVAKVAKMYRDAEKAMHNTAQEKAQLQQALAQPIQPVADDFGNVDMVAQLQQTVQQMQVKSTVNDFFSSNPDAKQYESAMAEIVTTNPAMNQLVNAGYLSVENLYQMAKGADSSREASLKTDGGREALQRVADKQTGKAVQGQATQTAFGSQEQKDLFREALLGRS